MAKATQRAERGQRKRPPRRTPDASQAVAPTSRALSASELIASSDLRFLEVCVATSLAASDAIPREVQIAFGCSQPKVTTVSDLLTARTTFALAVIATQTEVPLASVRADTEVAYRLTGRPADSALVEFASDQCIFQAWPYWRELVQSALGRMGLPGLRLPLIYHEEIPGLILESPLPQVVLPENK